ncbi:hypothetical protein IWT25_01937 [Secundilactobacillus pentosiphilus]|uniref:Uncharacterized protein n=1 Tax=Secundilactobacillus pentosiphilus TaxID=1714682 RepID=A0A1Z5IYE3_9LACO|nr:hypothetical protein [Secundilactobacillus pentosiphilus]GAX06592.1 hypothetical protein IWT25_01937 [Secundilactobacillus pentosiphilus]
MKQFDDQLDQWLEQITEVPLIHNLPQADQQNVTLIDSIVIQAAIEGYGKQPGEWNEALFADLFFNRFVRLLDDNEKQPRLFGLIPTALMALMEVVQPDQQPKLMNWIRKSHDKLIHLYDPVADKFYAQLSEAMRVANVDMSDQSKVAAFTRQYLRQHPEQGRSLFTKGI